MFFKVKNLIILILFYNICYFCIEIEEENEIIPLNYSTEIKYLAPI